MIRIPSGRRRQAVLYAGLAALVITLALGALGALRGLENETLDARFELRGTQQVDGLVVVGIDEHTFSSMDVTWPIRRNLHAEMIDTLREAGARRIVYDVQFTEPSGREADDLALFDAVAAAPGTVLATGESDLQGNTRVLGGDEQLKEIDARAAGSTFPSDAGGVIRRYSRENQNLTSLAAASAESVGRAPKRFDTGGNALIDFRGPAGTIPRYSFADVLDGSVDAAKFKDQIVVVGATAPVLQDVHATSAPGPRLMPGPELQANAIWTALNDNPLQESPAWLAYLLAAALGGLALALVVRFGPLRGQLAAAAIFAGYLLIAAIAFPLGLVLPVALPVIAVVATAAAAALVAVAGEMALRAHLSRYSAQLERDVQARTRDVVESQLEIVLRLAQAAELRDDDTGEHIDRMSTLCGDVARELGYTDADAELIRHAAALHDIGKIGVPDSILLKPGKLTAEEFDVMRTHVVNGADLLVGSTAPVLQLAEEICRTHHEKWDGSGYPNKIAGADIPLSGRIAAACDVFDALTNERPYKHAWTIEEACAEINRCRGAHFDPQVADALMAVLERRNGGPIGLPQEREQRAAA